MNSSFGRHVKLVLLLLSYSGLLIWYPDYLRDSFPLIKPIMMEMISLPRTKSSKTEYMKESRMKDKDLESI